MPNCATGPPSAVSVNDPVGTLAPLDRRSTTFAGDSVSVPDVWVGVPGALAVVGTAVGAGTVVTPTGCAPCLVAAAVARADSSGACITGAGSLARPPGPDPARCT